MTKQFFLLSTVSMLAACQTVSVPGDPGRPANGAGYEAHGTEPFWGLVIADGAMTFSHPDSPDIWVKSYDARPSFNGWRYTSAKISADITFTPCSDGMSDFTYKDSVTVKVNGFEYKGCGGAILPPEKMDDTYWMVVSIAGQGLNSDRQANFTFAEGRMSGSIGCNKLSASYKFENRQLSFGPVMSTKMGCPPPIGPQEAMFSKLLGEVISTEFTGDGSLVLTGSNEQKIVFTRSG